MQPGRKGGLASNRVERRWQGIQGPSTSHVLVADPDASPRTSISHVDPGGECSFHLRDDLPPGFPNIEEGSEGPEAKTFLHARIKRNLPLLWVCVHAQSLSCI